MSLIFADFQEVLHEMRRKKSIDPESFNILIWPETFVNKDKITFYGKLKLVLKFQLHSV